LLNRRSGLHNNNRRRMRRPLRVHQHNLALPLSPARRRNQALQCNRVLRVNRRPLVCRWADPERLPPVLSALRPQEQLLRKPL
jgi:hypothetical protein